MRGSDNYLPKLLLQKTDEAQAQGYHERRGIEYVHTIDTTFDPIQYYALFGSGKVRPADY